MGIHDIDSAPREQSTDRRPLSVDATLAVRILEGRPASELPDDTRNALAAAYIEQGQHARAIALLETSLRDRPSSAPLAATLTAAFYSRGTPGDRVRAFERAQTALESHPTNPLVLFNSALTAESILPGAYVRSAWQRYIEVERDPQWRSYATDRLKRVSDADPSAPRSADAIRADLLDAQLPAWADACIAAHADEGMHRARVRERANDNVLGVDRFFRDLLPYLVADGTDRCNARSAALVRELANGRALYVRDDVSHAGPIFRALASRSSSIAPIALLARLSAATTDYLGTGKLREAAIREFDAVASEAARRGYVDLLGRAHWMRGYVREDQSEYEGALRAYEASLDAYNKAASTNGTASGHNLIAGVLDRLGQYDRGWQHREMALEGLHRMTDSRARSTILTVSIHAASRDGLQRTALQLIEAKVAEEGVRRSGLRHAQALIERGELQAAAGRNADALETFARARTAIDGLGAGAARSRLEAQLSIAQSVGESDAAKARALLTRALDSYEESGSDVTGARLLLARARASLRAGDVKAADADLRQGVAVVERARSGLERSDFRLTYFDGVWDLFDELLDLSVARGDLDDALRIAERARGRLLREAHAASASDDGALRRPGPADSVVVYYLALRTRLVVWIFGGGAPSTIVKEIARSDLSSMVRQFAACASNPKSETCDSRALAELLIVPVLQRVGPTAMLTIVPDPALEPLPFAALRNPTTNRLLVEEVTLALSPSLQWLGRPSRRSSGVMQALVVGNPSPTELGDLPSAAEEARRIAALYDGPTLRAGANASRSVFLDDLPRADIVHFAGHAVADPELPDFSRLLMAPGPEGRGTVFAHELERMPLPRGPVVVLAACETAIGRTSRSEGMISLARAFMSAGARDVIATLWRIDDAASAPLFVRVHQALRRGDSAARALQSAQLEMLKSADPALRTPAAWASTVAWVSVGQ
jgi:CHAT domain-containing protein/tetratricopeptide (TPR) repeat protein